MRYELLQPFNASGSALTLDSLPQKSSHIKRPERGSPSRSAAPRRRSGSPTSKVCHHLGNLLASSRLQLIDVSFRAVIAGRVIGAIAQSLDVVPQSTPLPSQTRNLQLRLSRSTDSFTQSRLASIAVPLNLLSSLCTRLFTLPFYCVRFPSLCL